MVYQKIKSSLNKTDFKSRRRQSQLKNRMKKKTRNSAINSLNDLVNISLEDNKIEADKETSI